MEEFDAETRRQYLAEFDAQHRWATMNALSQLTQTTTVATFRAAFEDLMQGVTGISEPLLITFFICGLRLEVRRELHRLPEPYTLREAFAQACTCEARTTHSSTHSSTPSPSKVFASSFLSNPTNTTAAPTSTATSPIHQISEPPNQFPPLCLSPDPVILSPTTTTVVFPIVPPSIPTPDPSIYSPFNQFPNIQSLPLDAPLKTIISSGSLPSILPSSTVPVSDLFTLSKPPPDPPDPDQLDKREDELGPEPDLNPKNSAKPERKISRSTWPAAARRRGKKKLYGFQRIGDAERVFDEMLHKTNVSFPSMKSVKFLGEVPHKFPGVVEAVKKLRKDPKDGGMVMFAKELKIPSHYLASSPGIQRTSGVYLNPCPSLWNGIVCSDGNIAGSLPKNVAEFKSLKFLDNSYNMFYGELLGDIGQLEILQNLSLAGKNFTGPLLDSIGMLASIWTRELSHNRRFGSLPLGLKEVRNLMSLNLSFNMLIKKIPPGLAEIPNLETIGLSWNQLDGGIDWNFLMESSVVHVDLSGNLLTTSCPKELKFLSNMKFLKVKNEPQLREFYIPDYILELGLEVEELFYTPQCLVVVFISSKSGGQLGGDLLITYRKLLINVQVFDLGEEAPDKVLHKLYSDLERLKLAGDKLADQLHGINPTDSMLHKLIWNCKVLKRLDLRAYLSWQYIRISAPNLLIKRLVFVCCWNTQWIEPAAQFLLSFHFIDGSPSLYLLNTPSPLVMLARISGRDDHRLVNRGVSDGVMGAYRNGAEVNISVINVLVYFFCKCSRIQRAHRLFYSVLVKNLVSWTTMVTGYMQNSPDEEVLDMFLSMNMVDSHPHGLAYTGILSSCGYLMALQHGERVHGYAIKANLENDKYVKQGLIDMHGKGNSLGNARLAFDVLDATNRVLCNAMFEGYAIQEDFLRGIILSKKMRFESLHPNLLTSVSLLGESTESLARNDVYSKHSDLEDAKRVFEERKEMDLLVWNAMIFGYAQIGQGVEAVKLFHQLCIARLKSTDFTFVPLVATSINLTSFFLGSQIPAHIFKEGVKVNPHVTNVVLAVMLSSLVVNCRGEKWGQFGKEDLKMLIMFDMSSTVSTYSITDFLAVMILTGEGPDQIFDGCLYFHSASNKEEFHSETRQKIEPEIGKNEKWALRIAIDCYVETMPLGGETNSKLQLLSEVISDVLILAMQFIHWRGRPPENATWGLFASFSK